MSHPTVSVFGATAEYKKNSDLKELFEQLSQHIETLPDNARVSKIEFIDERPEGNRIGFKLKLDFFAVS